MIVENTGYLKLEAVRKLINNGERLGIYRTQKGTIILITNTDSAGEYLCYPKRDRQDYKLVDGEKITVAVERLFYSEKDRLASLNTNGWNNGNQIMSYKCLS